MDLLKKLIDERKPGKIAIDVSQTHAFSDGLSAGEREQLEEAIGPENRKKPVRAKRLALDFVALRAPEMVPVYQGLMENVHSIISRAFSNEVIQPGKTTDQDVADRALGSPAGRSWTRGCQTIAKYLVLH